MRLETINKYVSNLGFETRIQQTTDKKIRLSISLEITEYTKVGMPWSCHMVSQEMLNKLDKYFKRYKVEYSYGGELFIFVYRQDKTP